MAILAPVSAQEADGAGGTGTVVISVKYFTYPGKAALEGVEVWLFDGSNSHYACTDADGKVKFKDIPANVDLISASGRAVALPCSNPDFLNPDNGDQMLTYFFQKHHGVGEFDTFQVGIDAKIKLFYNIKTPKGQKKVCGNMLPTFLGTIGDDVFTGDDSNEVIVGKGGMDTLDGAGGNDLICGGKVGDDLSGGDGDDTIWGGLGSDDIDGGPGNDTIYGGDGNDTCMNGEAVFDCETII
jgi:Ca2+-binding RTX toxin-like protein